MIEHPILKDWYIWKRPGHSFLCLHGTVTGHPSERLNGYEVDTSELIELSFDENLARTKSRVYRLENPHPVFLEKFMSADYTYREFVDNLPRVMLLDGEK